MTDVDDLGISREAYHRRIRDSIRFVTNELARLVDEIEAEVGPGAAAATRRHLMPVRGELLQLAPFAADLLEADGWPRHIVEN